VVDGTTSAVRVHQTGAVYALAPSSSIASKPAAQWNTFEIEATGTTIKVTLNCRFSEPLDPADPEILKTFPPVGVRISQNLSPL